MPIRTLEDVLASWSRRAQSEVNVSLPGVVLDYDADTQTATVKPVVREAFEDDDEEVYVTEFEPIPQVPVCHWRGGGYTLHAPLEAGDFVTLVVMDRSIDEFMSTGNTDNIPQVLRRFDWSDAVAIPMPPAPMPISGLGDDMFMGREDGAAGVRISPTGKIAVEAAGQELIDLVRELLGICQGAVTGMGVPAFADAPSIAALSALDAKLSSMEI